MSNAPCIAQDGFKVHECVLSPADVNHLLGLLKDDVDAGRGGIRDVMSRVPELRAIADSLSIRALVRDVLGEDAFVVRATLFDKTPNSNWKVPWHQDVSIAVREKVPSAGYGPWSAKAGVIHVQPPAEILENMLSVRVHLDNCPIENGALKVISGSHRSGKIPENAVSRWIEKHQEIICPVGLGGVLLMRPLLLHSSSASSIPGHRRVLHFDYAASQLAEGIKWVLHS